MSQLSSSDCANWAGSRGAPSRSSIAGQRGAASVSPEICDRVRAGLRSTSSSTAGGAVAAAKQATSRPSRLSLRWRTTLLVAAWSRAWRDRAATSPGCLPRRLTSPVSGWSCCARVCPRNPSVGDPGQRRISGSPCWKWARFRQTAHTLRPRRSPHSEIRRAEDIALAFEAFSGHVQALYVVADPHHRQQPG